MTDLDNLHTKLQAHLARQDKEWDHFIYSKQDGFYQGLDEIKIIGSRSSEKRFEEYEILEHLSKNKTILDIGSNCGFFSIYVSKYVEKIFGVEINPYLVAISNDVKDYLNINNANFINSSFEEFHIDEKFDIIFSFANDSTIDDNTKFSFSEYIEKIKNLLKDNGLLIFESQAIDSIMSEQLDEKINYLKKDFIILKRKKVSSEYPKNVPFRDFLIFKNQT
jgi:cyclopropane fatty-acyl-phospholipid synthase-like methyltransferase